MMGRLKGDQGQLFSAKQRVGEVGSNSHAVTVRNYEAQGVCGPAKAGSTGLAQVSGKRRQVGCSAV
jgi:hypothetical protein